VTLTNLNTSARYEALSGEDGSFVLTFLAPGAYRLTAEYPGFQPFEISPLVVEVGSRVSVEVRLRVAAATESVTVQAVSSVIERNVAVGTTVNRQFVENLPLNGRSFHSLITTVPGVNVVVAGSSGALEPQGQFSVKRQHRRQFGGVAVFVGQRLAARLERSGRHQQSGFGGRARRVPRGDQLICT
jgi:hypothetical protein